MLCHKPAVAVTGEKPIGFFGSPTTFGISDDRWRAWGRPALENGIHQPPGLDDLVVARKEQGVTVKSVEQEALIGVGDGAIRKSVAIVKFQIDCAHLLTQIVFWLMFCRNADRKAPLASASCRYKV